MWYKKKTVVSCTRYGNTSFVVGHNSPADKYKNRTGLYADQVLEGNATLLLRNVTPHDEGKYFCITMTEPSTDESGVISLVVKGTWSPLTSSADRHVSVQFHQFTLPISTQDDVTPVVRLGFVVIGWWRPLGAIPSSWTVLMTLKLIPRWRCCT